MDLKRNKKQLLVIEDNPGDARLVKELLKGSSFAKYTITYARSVQELDSIADTMKFEVILLDLHLPDVRPADTFKRVNAFFPMTPIIILTGLDDDVIAAKIVRQGAQDYLVKGTFDEDTLQRSLKYAIYRKSADTKLAKQKTKSRKLQDRSDSFETETIRLAKVNEAKDVFLSVASHQLRTPATSVKQYLGMVLNGFAGDLEPMQKEFLETAYRNNERQLKIVDDLLKVARLDAGQIVLQKKHVDITELIRSVIDDQAGTFKQKEQNVVIAVDKPVHGSIDENNMRMVFENLIDNASKYSEVKSDIIVEITKAGKWLSCKVRDSGIGISEEDQRKLFKKFSRSDEAFSHSPNGSGLGLYWAREIVKLHNGHIQLTSTKGKGSTFEVMLPA